MKITLHYTSRFPLKCSVNNVRGKVYGFTLSNGKHVWLPKKPVKNHSAFEIMLHELVHVALILTKSGVSDKQHEELASKTARRAASDLCRMLNDRTRSTRANKRS